MPDNTLSTLNKIRIKIRRLTRNPSSSQLTDDQIDEYVNTFVLYDFPNEIRIDALKGNLVFYTAPNVDTYKNNTTDPDDPLYNFLNKYYRIQTPAYVGGYRAYLTESEEEFYYQYPRTKTEDTIATGDGVSIFFTGSLVQTNVLKNSLIFSSVDSSGNTIEAYDDGQGNIIGDVPIFPPIGPVLGTNTINYETGEYNIEFNNTPASGQAIYARYHSYKPSRPHSILLFDEEFIFRPVPDKTYRVQIQAFKRPSELLEGTSMPELAQWWQYIAYGAAIKVFQDRSNVEGVQELMPEYKRQELLVLRKTITQLSDERAATLYTQQSGIVGSNDDFNNF